MGYSVRVLPEHRLAVVRLSGYVEGFELIRALDALYRAPGLEPGYRTAWDARRVHVLDLLPLHVASLSEATERVDPRLGVGRTAVLGRGERDEVTLRLLTLRYRRTRQRRVRAFTRVDEAAAWLHVPADALEGPPEAHGEPGAVTGEAIPEAPPLVELSPLLLSELHPLER